MKSKQAPWCRCTTVGQENMRAVHGQRRGRGPLLLAAAVGAALLFAALRRPGGNTELPQLPQSFLDGVALASNPWPKVQARERSQGHGPRLGRLGGGC